MNSIEQVLNFILLHYIAVKQIWKLIAKNELLLFILSFLPSIILLAISIIVLTICAIYKFIIHAILKIRYGGRYMGIISGCDAMLTVGPPDFQIINVLVFIQSNNGSKLLNDIKEKIKGIQRNPGVYEKLFTIRNTFMGYVCRLLVENLKTEEIVKEIDKVVMDEDVLKSILSEIFEAPLPRSNNFNWDIFLCTTPLLRNKVEVFPIILRMHHSLADGLSVYNILTSILSKTSQTDYSQKFTKSVKTPARYTTKLKEPFPLAYGTHIFSNKTYENVALEICTEVEEECMIKIKKIKEAHPEFSFSNIVLAAYSASFTEFLLKTSIKVPEFIPTMIPVQVNAKRFSKLTNEFHNEFKNDFTFINLRIPIVDKNIRDIAVENSLMDRMNFIRNELNLVSSTFDAKMFYIILKTYFEVIPYNFLGGFEKPHSLPNAVNIFPGGPKLTVFNGDSIEDILFFLPVWKFVGVAVMIFTYDNRLNISILSNDGLFENNEDLKKIGTNIYKYIDVMYKKYA